MVARGDLGLEMPLERVPRAQKDITRRARQHGIPVIVATQVLESMTVEPRPTRAEVSDAANAVDDGVDAIMLAGETAVGAFPRARCRRSTRSSATPKLTPPIGRSAARATRRGQHDHAQALCEAAVTLANRGDAQAIVAVTRGGGTARRLSALRPRAPIFATTDRDEMARRLALYWGVVPVCTDIGENVDAAGTLDRPAARRARPGGGRLGRRPRQHQPGPDAQRRELPEDPAALMVDVNLHDHRRGRPGVRRWRPSSSASRGRSSTALLDALDIVSADNRAAVHARAKQLTRRADAARLRRRGARQHLARALARSGSASRDGISAADRPLAATHGINVVVIVAGAFVVVRAANLAIEHLQFKLGAASRRRPISNGSAAPRRSAAS